MISTERVALPLPARAEPWVMVEPAWRRALRFVAQHVDGPPLDRSMRLTLHSTRTGSPPDVPCSTVFAPTAFETAATCR